MHYDEWKRFFFCVLVSARSSGGGVCCLGTYTRCLCFIWASVLGSVAACAFVFHFHLPHFSSFFFDFEPVFCFYLFRFLRLFCSSSFPFALFASRGEEDAYPVRFVCSYWGSFGERAGNRRLMARINGRVIVACGLVCTWLPPSSFRSRLQQLASTYPISPSRSICYFARIRVGGICLLVFLAMRLF